MIKNRLKQVPLLQLAARGYGYVRGRMARDVWMLEGEERTSGERLTLLFVGQLENKDYLAHLLFDGACGEQRFRASDRKLERLASDSRVGHALAVVERERRPARLVAGTFFIPCWVGGEIDLAAAERLRRSSGQVNADLRRIRKRSYDLVVERGREPLMRFYDTMYRPYLQTAYGARAFVVAKSEVEAKAGVSELIVVHERGEAVAGQILLYENAGVRGWLVGVKDGEAGYVRDGAVAAIYHFATRYLAAKGFDRLHAGASRPFLSDGVLRYKKKWGMRLSDATPHGFVLTPVRRSPAVDSFLVRNPFVYPRAGVFYAAVFAADNAYAPSVVQLDAWRLDGMAGFTIFRPLAGASAGGWVAAGFQR